MTRLCASPDDLNLPAVQEVLAAEAAAASEVAARVEAVKEAAAALLQAKGAVAARRSEVTAAREASALAKRTLAAPPAPLVLRCGPPRAGEALKPLTLEQLLDRSIGDSHVRRAHGRPHEHGTSGLALRRILTLAAPQETSFEVSMAAEALLELLQSHFGAAVANALAPIADAEREVEAAAREADEVRRRAKEAPKREGEGAKAAAAAQPNGAAAKAEVGASEDAASNAGAAAEADAGAATVKAGVGSPAQPSQATTPTPKRRRWEALPSPEEAPKKRKTVAAATPPHSVR